MEAHLLERIGERVAARMLAEHDARALEPDIDRIHDLVGGPFGHHAVLVDPGFMSEGVGADTRLVRGHRIAGEHRDEPRSACDLLRVNDRVAPADRLASAQCHHYFLERAVPGSLAYAIDGDLDLSSPRPHPRQCVGYGESEVVMGMDAPDHLF